MHCIAITRKLENISLLAAYRAYYCRVIKKERLSRAPRLYIISISKTLCYHQDSVPSARLYMTVLTSLLYSENAAVFMHHTACH